MEVCFRYGEDYVRKVGRFDWEVREIVCFALSFMYDLMNIIYWFIYIVIYYINVYILYILRLI